MLTYTVRAKVPEWLFNTEPGPADTTSIMINMHVHKIPHRVSNYLGDIRSVVQRPLSSHELSELQNKVSEMFTKISSLLLALASTSMSLASPVIQSRQIGLSPSCNGFAEGAFDTASNFTLSAFNQPLTEGATGTPLVIALFETFGGTSFYALSVSSASAPNSTSIIFCESTPANYCGAILIQTQTSAPPTDFPNLSLISGGLIGNGPSGTATAENVPVGFEPQFFTPSSLLEPPAQVWCGVVSIYLSIFTPLKFLMMSLQTAVRSTQRHRHRLPFLVRQ